jgi:hypothetical protein
MRAKEAAPGVRVAPRRRWHPGLDQDVAHGTCRDGDAELAQLASDPEVAPARVLAREAEDQFAHIPADRRPAWPAVRIRPAPRYQPAMPG